LEEQKVHLDHGHGHGHGHDCENQEVVLDGAAPPL